MVELGQRYRAGVGGVRVTFPDGTETQLAPFGRIVFEAQPKKIEGRLLRVGRRGHLQFEAPSLEPEVKS